MDRRYFIANWKSHFTIEEADKFLTELNNGLGQIDLEKNVLIVCPSFTLLDFCSRKILELALPIQLGAQSVSSYEDGAYTGEVSARQAKEFASYTLVGHSERKKYQHETDEDVREKTDRAKAAGLQVIQCVQATESFIAPNADFIAYEPPSAISTFGEGVPDDPGDIEQTLSSIRLRCEGKVLVYGGSVNPETIKNYAHVPNCSGFLVGGASLDARTFLSLPLAC